MLGMFFVHIAPGGDGSGQMLVKTGIVKSAVGADRWLLEFTGKGFNFSNVFRSEQLEQFAFFNTPAARQAFITELMTANTPSSLPIAPNGEIPRLTEEPPAPAEPP
jgi:hypothetical protein